MFAPPAGTIIAGKYRIERTLGVGGMGLVLAATHLGLEQRVAIKVLLPSAMEDKDLVARFAREGKLAAKIASEHVARVLDVDQTEEGTPFLVMEYLEGEDLRAVVTARGPLPIEESVEYVLQACDAVAMAHAAGIIHRDLKPANLFLTHRHDGSPCIKVLDFGISKVIGATGDGMTTGMVGSPIYMSPEQMISSRNVDVGADIWSLGAILFRLVAGKPPYDAETIVKLAAVIATEPPASLRAARPDVPPALEAIVNRCLARERDGRFANVRDLAIALEPYAPARVRSLVQRIAGAKVPGSSQGRSFAPPASSESSLEFRAGTLTSQTTDATPSPPRRRGATAVVLVALLVASATGGAAALRARMLGQTRAATSPSSSASAPSSTEAVKASSASPPETSATSVTSVTSPTAAPSTPASGSATATVASSHKGQRRPPGTSPPRTRQVDGGGPQDTWGWER